ncbi:MAG: glycosyltransferase family 2 protein [Candidatus Thorarchaeota archaeon]
MKTNFIILIPAFNEQYNLDNVVQNLTRIVPINNIIIADDGSTDDTSEIAMNLGLKIIKNDRNYGKGYTLRKAFLIILTKFPKIKWIITYDSDGQHHFQDIKNFIQKVKKDFSLGIIIGRRDYNKMPKKNKISNLLTSGWCKYWLNWDISDLQCGYRCYNTKQLRNILSYGLKRNKFDFETEILLVAWLNNIKMREIPIKTVYIKKHRRTKIIAPIDTFRWIFLIMRFGFSLRFIREIWIRRRMQYKKNYNF